MLGTHWVDGAPVDTEQIDLTGLPELLAAHRQHRDLLRHRPDAVAAFEVAHAVAVSWWAQRWPEEEQWPRRERRTAPPGADPGWWRLLVRDAVTYPETVALTSVLTDNRTRQRLLTNTGGHLPHTLAHAPELVAELARVTRRPWLPERIALTSAGPLLVWVQQRVRADADAAVAERPWMLHMAHRPRPIARELTAYRNAAQQPEETAGATRLHLGLRHTSDQAFTTGLAHARAYAAVHGHLAAPIGERFNGFTLGRWLSNHRKFPAMPPEHVAELEALDPWWRPPWTVMWQRSYYEARDHARARGPLPARTRLPHHHLRPGRMAVQPVHRLRRPAPRTTAPPGRHRPHTRARPGGPAPPQAHGHPLPARPRLRTRLRRHPRHAGRRDHRHRPGRTEAGTVAVQPAQQGPRLPAPPRRLLTPGAGTVGDRPVVEPAPGRWNGSAPGTRHAPTSKTVTSWTPRPGSPAPAARWPRG